MFQLGARDLEAALEFARLVHATDDLQAFREVVPAVRQLVAADTIGYNEIDLERATAFVISDAPTFDGIEQRFLELAHQHPMVPHQRRGDLSPYLMSDFLSERTFHRLDLYNDVYGRLGIEDQIAFGLPGKGIVAINLGRSRRSFTERDRQVLALVRPHLGVAYRRAADRERTRALIEELDRGLEDRRSAILQLDAGGAVSFASSSLAELLDAYFVSQPREGRELLAWLGSADGNGELTIDGPRGRLRARVQGAGAWLTVLFDEQRSTPPDVRALGMLGLTPRQAQVLRLLACGKRNEQIARELAISVATVGKHLEHIYDRLGVSSRGQAVALAYGTR